MEYIEEGSLGVIPNEVFCFSFTRIRHKIRFYSHLIRVSTNNYCNQNERLVCATCQGAITVNQQAEQECLNCQSFHENNHKKREDFNV